MSEIVEPVDLALGRRLNPDAVGWTRRPLHRTALPWTGRAKRWEYWGVVTRRFVLGLTIADLDYANLTQVYAYDRLRHHEVSLNTTKLGPLRPGLSDALPPITASSGPLTFADHGRGTRLSVDHERVKVALEAEGGDDALGVVVPWSPRRFQYTLKDPVRPVSGTIEVDGEREAVVAGWGVLDRGRGIWPYRMRWNWGAGSGEVSGRRIGLQLGGKWTDGTGQTENGLFVDGRLHHWIDDLRWEYDLEDPESTWTVTGPDVEAVLTPFHRRVASTQLGVIASRTHQAFGRWSGWARGGKGVEYRLDGLLGWAEEARNRW
ncbi:DUF2804 domain-containing protein [Aeromicrobium sp. Marseille-Q0843]|uniref:DUF2804 domain-containing protein n=1 Tax=Aeromicrobium phoceense TaxID=2754045 RepID=A0A838XDM2_9ACTN|nr:DUF2804 domain-containing protein [Aeromicrobium phoceense]MBA4608635.1 DUF2804 domain-containing protein [Aeromicrobium phoceense]